VRTADKKSIFMKLTPLLALFFLPLIIFAQQENAYHVNGEVNFPKGDETGRNIYFVYQQNGKQKIDSTLINNNKFSFSGMADITVKASLQFTRPYATPEPALDPNTLSFYLNNGLTTVKATGFLSRAQVVGSPVEDGYIAFLQRFSKWDRPLTSFGRRKRSLGKNDTLKLRAVNKSVDSVQNIKMNELLVFLNEDITKPYAVEAILMYLRAKGSSLDMGKAETYFKQLPENEKQSADGQEVAKIIADLKKR